MKWHATLTVIIVCLAGCHAPTPSFDLLAPYGSSRVPPPSTGSHGTDGAYYNRTAPPTTSVPEVRSGKVDPSAPQKTQSNVSGKNPFLASGDLWKPLRTNATPEPAPAFGGATDNSTSRILPVSYNGTAKVQTAVANTTPQFRSADTETAKSSLRLNGMPVTDATRRTSSSEPARFQPPGDAVEISQLPRVAESSSQQNAMGTVVSSAKSSDRIKSPPSGSSTSTSTLQWRSSSSND